jgi:hypothetical protein
MGHVRSLHGHSGIVCLKLHKSKLHVLLRKERIRVCTVAWNVFRFIVT